MTQSDDPSPVNPLPPVVAALFLVLIGIELVFQAGTRGFAGGPEAVGWRLAAVQNYAFSAPILDWMIETGRWPVEHVIRFVSYPFVHGSLMHAVFGGIILLAMGKIVAEAFGAWRMLVMFFAASALGALAYALVMNDPVPLIGALPGDYGLIGGFTFILWYKLGQIGANQSRAFAMITILMLLQLAFGLVGALFGGSMAIMNSDWIADLTGFVTGFGLSFLLVPGGWSRLRSHIRHD